MAVGTEVPDRLFMFPCIDREIGIMDGKSCRLPARIRCMTIRADCGKIQTNMIRICGSLEVRLMTSITCGRSIGIIPIRMAFDAFHIGMSEGELK